MINGTYIMMIQSISGVNIYRAYAKLEYVVEISRKLFFSVPPLCHPLSEQVRYN